MRSLSSHVIERDKKPSKSDITGSPLSTQTRVTQQILRLSNLSEGLDTQLNSHDPKLTFRRSMQVNTDIWSEQNWTDPVWVKRPESPARLDLNQHFYRNSTANGSPVVDFIRQSYPETNSVDPVENVSNQNCLDREISNEGIISGLSSDDGDLKEKRNQTTCDKRFSSGSYQDETSLGNSSKNWCTNNFDLRCSADVRSVNSRHDDPNGSATSNVRDPSKTSDNTDSLNALSIASIDNNITSSDEHKHTDKSPEITGTTNYSAEEQKVNTIALHTDPEHKSQRLSNEAQRTGDTSKLTTHLDVDDDGMAENASIERTDCPSNDTMKSSNSTQTELGAATREVRRINVLLTNDGGLYMPGDNNRSSDVRRPSQGDRHGSNKSSFLMDYLQRTKRQIKSPGLASSAADTHSAVKSERSAASTPQCSQPGEQCAVRPDSHTTEDTRSSTAEDTRSSTAEARSSRMSSESSFRLRPWQKGWVWNRPGSQTGTHMQRSRTFHGSVPENTTESKRLPSSRSNNLELVMACVHAADTLTSAGSPGSSTDSACESAESARSSGSLSQSAGSGGQTHGGLRLHDADDGYFTSSTDHRISVSSPAVSPVDGTPQPGATSPLITRDELYSSQELLEQTHRQQEIELLQQLVKQAPESTHGQQDELLDHVTKEPGTSKTLGEPQRRNQPLSRRRHRCRSLSNVMEGESLSDAQKVHRFFANKAEKTRHLMSGRSTPGGGRSSTLKMPKSSTMGSIGRRRDRRVELLVARQSREMLQLVNSKSSDSPDGARPRRLVQPAVIPSCSRKTDLLASQNLSAVDMAADRLVGEQFSTYTQLVRALTQPYRSDLCKVRSIFRWLVHQPLENLSFSDQLDSESPFGLLRAIRDGTRSYHFLFKRLCSYAGIPVEIISGFSKGSGYRPGMSVCQRRFRNAWCAVYVCRQWRFVNCHWAARRVCNQLEQHQGVASSLCSKLEYNTDEFYFLTDPEQHIYEHFPDEPHWQLLTRPVSIADFQAAPLRKSPFFNYGLSFWTPYCGAVQADLHGNVKVKLRLSKPLAVTATLEPDNKTPDIPVNRKLALVSVIEEEVEVWATTPRAGEYVLSVYVSADASSASWQLACSFQVLSFHSAIAPVHCPASVPYIGSTPEGVNVGVSLNNYRSPVIDIRRGTAQLLFESPRNVPLVHSLLRLDNSQYCDRSAFLRTTDDTDITFAVNCTDPGDYLFTLMTPSNFYHSDRSCSHSTMRSRCSTMSSNLFIGRSNTIDRRHHLTVNRSRMSEREQKSASMSRSHSSTLSRKQYLSPATSARSPTCREPSVYKASTLDKKTLCLPTSSTPRSTSMMTSEELHNFTYNSDTSKLLNTSDTSSMRSSVIGGGFVTLYVCLLRVRDGSSDPQLFPRYSKGWVGCSLLSPISGELSRGCEVELKIQTPPHIAEMSVGCSEGHWSPMRRSAASGTWSLLYTPLTSGKLQVYGRRDTLRDRYRSFLEFTII